MTGDSHQQQRLRAIDRRMHGRKIRRWQHERAPEDLNKRRLAFLRELCGHIDAGFTPAELMAAEASLATSPQNMQLLLPLSRGPTT